MAGLKMSLKLSQQLRMTPQLQQAIKLLQLSRMELQTAIRKELVENPVLEEAADMLGEDPAEMNDEISGDIQNTEEKRADDSDPTKQDEFDWEAHIDNNRPVQNTTGQGNDEIMNYENMISTTKTLHEHLHWQAGMAGFNEEELEHISTLISYVDDDGWIKTPLDEIAAEEEMSVKDLEEIIPFLQEFDPPGIGSRTLQECLHIQARHLQEDTNDLLHIIDNHLKELERKNFPAIARAMDQDVEYIVDLCKVILSMEPKPGRSFAQQDVYYITPDVYVYKLGDEYVVSLNEDGLPRLRVSSVYKDLMQQHDEQIKKEKEEAKQRSKDGEEAQEYIKDKFRSAIWLIKSIHQRQRTIYKVTESIVKHQEEFFEKGAAHIKPMILKDIANDIGMHESTVSRVTTNKYVHTPRGIYELKYFFNSGISRTDGNDMASESVKLKIKELVAAEDPKKPLSDQKIVDALKKDGIKIARRTVAKYRDVLKILPSSKRKTYY